ncbi:stage II sporulation protein D [Salirhabdus salicampi]|uniref:stage II sporulation protein D n=1 Tax=Salirhabdus salicampi TaxID=476102 RepID=UPI0020C4ED89|nr:stage II sporulation protein D [Salirhabdus salicampi]MCP8617462.1 stage II sporulation protein D [Salirhabdus salicampi]
MNWKYTSIYTALVIVVVVLIIPAAIVAPFITADEAEQNYEGSQETREDETEEVDLNDGPHVAVFRTVAESVEDVPLETYVARVVASEMPAEFEKEALKAQALAARTYIVRKQWKETEEGEFHVTDTIQDQVYKDEEQLRKIWGSDFNWKMKKIKEAVLETKGEIIVYNEEPITATFFSTSNGYTENAEEYWQNAFPYLTSVESPWDTKSPKFRDQKTYPISEVEEMLDVTFSGPEAITKMTRTDSNRVKEIVISGKSFTGREIREALHLSSSDFNIQIKGDHMIFTTKGYGHGVGLSQYGANGMAEAGKSYQEIIQHYYQGTEIIQADEIFKGKAV